ncbi:exodeoxyribonuclease VII large subunit [Krasilnikoviella flava]|uniref:Exodeoxyribonuclease 7 large subunit n=1 Tax=Krasilnikoviella flava TaxID=526729 RepID=A0A1T5JL15_9MICO|nr:exodeoxyribonuclease VII large subunit [Krasilnikoviella flava]SKC52099.1 Exodeoxyribonuclease VII large subunit [Krasilnikoviella flava]
MLDAVSDTSQPQAQPQPLPELARETTPERPWPVRLLSAKIRDYVARMSAVWVEGQVVEHTYRGRSGLQFVTLRDTDAEASLPVHVLTKIYDGLHHKPEVGDHVVVQAKPEFWMKNGRLSMRATAIRQVGVGELLARIDQLRRVLAAEGLFDLDRKLPLPFLPAVVGLVCGRESKAEHDVVVNARARWPQVRFEIREVAVQGVDAVREVSAAIAELDARPEVEVIVVARGGGSVEDLLPFSNEALVRAAAGCTTPLVSAIGHETDAPLLDLVADHRASTPTDAAKQVVPDVAEERQRLDQARRRMRAAVAGRVAREQHGLDALRSRPALARPQTTIDVREREIAQLVRHSRHRLDAALLRAAGEVGRLEAQVRALSPQATLERGYAVVQRGDGHVVRAARDVEPGDAVHVRVADGALDAAVTATASPAPRG